jgi:hypothetical protein
MRQDWGMQYYSRLHKSAAKMKILVAYELDLQLHSLWLLIAV